MPLRLGTCSTRERNYDYLLKTNAYCGIYHWHVRNALSHDAVKETDVFDIGGTRWKLKLKLGIDSNSCVEMRVTSKNRTPMEIWVKATTINQLRVRSDRSRGSTMNLAGQQSHGLNLMRMGEIGDNAKGFILNDSLLFAVEIQILCINNNFVEGTPVLSNRRVSVELLSDQDIHDYVDNKIAFGLGGHKQNGTLRFSESTPLNTVVEEILQDSEDDVRLWLCTQRRDGTLAAKYCLNAFPVHGICLGELAERDDTSNDVVSIRFYLEPFEEDCDSLSNDDNSDSISIDSMIFFVKCVNLAQEKMMYLGSIVLDATADVRDLVEVVTDFPDPPSIELPVHEASILNNLYYEVDQICIQRLAGIRTLHEIGLQSGSVLLIHTEADTYSGNLADSLMELFLRAMDTIGRSSSASSDVESEGSILETVPWPPARRSTAAREPTRSEEKTEPLCVICMEGPQTSGFIHDHTSHRCVCERCAKTWMEQRKPCPICMARIDAVVYAYY